MDIHWIVLLCAIIPFWILQNTIHELSHGLTIWLGWKWKFKIWPFPSYRLGRFSLACVTYEATDESKDITPAGFALVSIMPKIVDVALFLIAMFCAVMTANIPTLALLLLLFATYNVIDFIYGAIAIFMDKSESDIWKFQELLNIKVSDLKWAAVGCSLFLLLLNSLGVAYVWGEII
jgi:hypothetical protein